MEMSPATMLKLELPSDECRHFLSLCRLQAYFPNPFMFYHDVIF